MSATISVAVQTLRHELTLLILSRYPLVALESADEGQTERLVERVAADLGLPLAVWTSSQGLVVGRGRRPETRDPDRALAEVLAHSNELLALFHDLDPYLERPEVSRRLRDAERVFGDSRSALILAGGRLELPEPWNHRVVRMAIRLPDTAELETLVRRTAEELDRGGRARIALSPEAYPRVARALTGLEREEARRILLSAALGDGVLEDDDLAHIFEGKRRRVQETGAVDWVDPGSGLADLGGAPHFKRWIDRRREAFSERAKRFGLDAPRGLLLAGVPGTGKSLACRSVAGEWGMPLLRLDVGSLYDKYIGATEANLRRALATAEAMAPSVLWVDEIEKAVRTGGGGEAADGGVSQRLLGTLLTWLQERPAPVFVLATANDVEALPVELTRRGRFDEVFFFDLPEAAEREHIFAVHLKSRGRSPDGFDIPRLAAETEGFSGAEIEGVVVAGLYSAFAESSALTTELLAEEIAATRPLSRLRPEAITRLRAWGRDHAVGA